MISIDWTNEASILKAIKEVPGIFGSEVPTFLEHAAAILVGKTADLAPTGTGAAGGLATSILYDRPTAGSDGWKIRYGTDAEHAEPIEYGRTPGSSPPPVEEITRWLWLKGPGMGFEFEDEEDSAGIAYLMARKIGKEGFASGPVAGINGGTAWAMFSRGRKEAKDEVDQAADDCRRRIEKRINERL